MSRLELLNDGGYRSDGRRQYELRAFDVRLGGGGGGVAAGGADGSATVSHGLTTVLVSVYGPREARLGRSHTSHERAVLNVEVSVAPFSTMERRERGRGDKLLTEFAAAVKATFEPVIQTRLYPRSQIDIFVQVLQQDGGVLQAAINAATLALIDAGIPLRDYVCACTSACLDTHSLLDLNGAEESDLPHLTLAVLPRSGKVTLVTMETRLHIDRFEEIFNLAIQAGRGVLHKEMDRAVRASMDKLLHARTGGAAALGGEAKTTTEKGAVETEDLDMADV